MCESRSIYQVSTVVRVLAWYARGPGFKSCLRLDFSPPDIHMHWHFFDNIYYVTKYQILFKPFQKYLGKADIQESCVERDPLASANKIDIPAPSFLLLCPVFLLTSVFIFMPIDYLTALIYVKQYTWTLYIEMSLTYFLTMIHVSEEWSFFLNRCTLTQTNIW